MDNFDSHRTGDRYSNSSEEPSGRHSRSLADEARLHDYRQDNYRGGGGGRRSPLNLRSEFSSSGGRGSDGGSREHRRPFDSFGSHFLARSVDMPVTPSPKPQSPQDMPSSLQSESSNAASFSNTQSLYGSHIQPGEVPAPRFAGQTSYDEVPSPQQLLGWNEQLSALQPQVQHSAQRTPGQAPPGATQQQQPTQLLQRHFQSPSELAQMLSQQKQALQATFQSSQQALNQLQQQLQPSNQNLIAHQSPLAAKQQDL